MATLTISNFNGKASRNTITFSYSVNLKPATDISTGLSTLQAQEKEVASTTQSRTVSGVDSVTGGNNLSGSVTGTYTRVAGSDGPTKHTVELTCYYDVMQRTRSWEFVGYGQWQQSVGPPSMVGTIPIANYYYEYLPSNGTSGYILVGDSIPQSDGSYRVYQYPFYREKEYDWSAWTSWSIVSSKSVTQTAGTYYKSPANFTFNNCSSGQKWKVNDGLQSLITNIYDFTDYATQWRYWMEQSNLSGPCPAWAKSSLTANNLNSIHDYVVTGKTYSSKQIVSADMFNSLATKINAG